MTLAVMRGVDAHGRGRTPAAVPSMGERLTRVRAWMLVTAAALVAGLALPAASHAANEITEATPNAINQTFDFEAGELILRGTADADVTGVQVTLDDADETTAPITLPADLVAGSEGSTWTRVFSGLAVRNLEDGTLTASAQYAVGGTEVTRSERTILKDLQAPAAPPTALPVSSYFNLDLDVRLTAEPGETIHCTLDGTAPTAATPPCLGSITVTGTTTIRALAVDAAGNAGPEAAFTYTLDDDAPVTTVDVPAGFHATPVPVTLTATDAGSGVEATWYTTNGDDPRDPAGSRAVYDPGHKPTLSDGQRLQFASEDIAATSSSRSSPRRRRWTRPRRQRPTTSTRPGTARP
jgi:hypothetical protein